MRAAKLAGILALFSVSLMQSSFTAWGRTENAAETKMEAGEALSDRGQFEDAVARWKEAERAFRKSKDASGEIRALLQEASAYQALGQHHLAVTALNSAGALARDSRDAHADAEVKAARGALCIFSREAVNAEPLLRESLEAARAERDTALAAKIQNNLGILLSAQGHATEAMAAFETAVRDGDPELVAKARKNMADAAFAAQEYARAEHLANEAAEAAAALPDGHEKAFLLVGVAELLQQIFVDSPEHHNALRTQAFRLDQEAENIAEKSGDRTAQAFALGDEGALYEFEKRYPEALTLTRRAVFIAQQAQSADTLYRWEWQTGRLLAKQGEREAAIQAYRRTIATLQTIRNDIAIRHGNPNAHSSFRDAVGAVYYELADLLLQRADEVKDDGEVQTLLHEARDTAEMLKAAELEDYFQDDCVNLLKSKIRKVENISPKAAVIYIIPLPNRTELLVSLASGRLERFKAEVSDEKLTETVRLFRLNLEDRATDSYLEQGQQLYGWLIKPLEPLMTKAGLDTMVFVPDGALRTVPMAALHDGEHFLIEKYAVAVTPGLELMETKAAERVQPLVMIRGLSEARDGFPPLVNVPEEVAEIKKLYSKSDALMNEQFVHDATGDTLRKEHFTIVHIASHGHFDDDVHNSFVLTYDKHLTLNDLEAYIRPGQLRDHPLDLLTLSACQTAAGDDRAALGLAGIAVKAGARSAFATLWSVNDAASTQLVGDFYTELTTHPEWSKAQALQAAQKKLLVQYRYAHPCYWAPYLIIGNWL
ncbi:MAG TPA: CHAT domain-containing protein [Chthoniobacter sp.]|jgi:CHAT domain-containing protein